jgi:hypothetical protein
MTMKFHLISVRTGIKNTTTNAATEAGKKGTLIYCWREYKLVQPLWKSVWRFLKKLKIELPYDPLILLLDIYSQVARDTCILMLLQHY